MEFEDFDRLEKYINNELSTADKKALEIELKSNPVLQKQLGQLKNVSEATEAFGLKLKLDQIHEELYPENSNPKIRKIYFYAAAACISLLLIGWWFSTAKQSADALFTQFFEVYPDYISSRGEEDRNLETAMGFYNTDNYAKASSELQKLYKTNNQNQDVSFYLGLSFLNQGKAKKAIEILTDVIKNSDKYKQQARWYLALAYLNSNQLSQAKTTLNNINENEYKFNEAMQLVPDIDQLVE